MNDFSTVIFDLDGTLLNSLGDLTDSVNHTLRLYGLPPCTEEQIRRRVGNGTQMLLQRCLPQGREDPRFEEICRVYQEYYLSHSRIRTAPYDGVPEMLEALRRRGVGLGIVSNKFHDAVRDISDAFFAPWIEVAVGESDTVRRKPAPDGIRTAMELLHADPARTLYVGDSEVDIVTAKNAGIDCVSVCWGFRDREQLIEAGATRLIDRPEELLTVKGGR